jgi:hypothetical protein
VTLTPRLQTWAVTLLFVALTIYMTWPQAAQLATHAHGHFDVYFNMWRLAWIAHALTTAPSQLFNGNIFHPEPRVMTLSDTMLVEGVLATPLYWLGLPPVLIHNLMMLGAIVSSAVGVFVLARHLTGSAGAGVVAGVVFAFVPYRFDHLMHMELQWTVWMPWGLWALHRTFETQSWKYGVLTGLFASLQTLSSIYYGVFFAMLLAVIDVVLLVPHFRRPRGAGELVKALAPVPLVAVIVCGPYAMPYLQTKSGIVGRSEMEVMRFSAMASSYLATTPNNVLYGRMAMRGNRPERRLFPGLLIVVLAVAGLLRKQASWVDLAYLLAAVAAFDLSLGLRGFTYSVLFNHMSFFVGFRALARVGIFVILFLAVLGAYGYAALLSRARPPVRRVVLGLTVAILLLEYRVRSSPPLYAWLARQAPGVVAELPMPRLENWPGSDARISYLSTFHWHPMVNGYSGFMPQSYEARMAAMREFPDARSVERLRQDGVRYVVVHLVEYRANEGAGIVDTLVRHHILAELGRFWDGDGDAVVLEVR